MLRSSLPLKADMSPVLLWLVVSVCVTHGLKESCEDDLTLSGRRLTQVLIGSASASTPLAIRSPQTCLAGQYCAGRAGSSYGTGSCPKGYFCGPGSVAPAAAPSGSFVGNEGSVRSYACGTGSFGPYGALGDCLACPPGYSCVRQGMVTPNMCEPGTYRSSTSANSISCSPCPEGTFSPLRGVADETSCEPCPTGRICLTKTANITASNPCAEGYMCGAGTTLALSTQQQCPPGFFCPKETTPLTVFSSLCPSTFVCKTGTSFADRFRLRCPVGFYCPEGAPWRSVMEVPLQPAVAFLSKGQFYVLQVAGQFCLRQSQVKALAALPTWATEDERAIQLSLWTDDITACVFSQMAHISSLSRNVPPLAVFVATQWHASKLLSLVPNLRPDRYTNKCMLDQFARVDANSTWDCLCSANATDGSLIACLTTQTNSTNLGAPFTYEASYGIDDEERNCSPWPKCLDWSRLDNYVPAPVVARSVTPGEVSKTSGPSTGPAEDDFDLLAAPLIDYIAEAIMRVFLLYSENAETALTACPYGTSSASDGLGSVDSCVKRSLIASLGDPDEIIVYRVNPVTRALSNQAPRTGYPFTAEEDLRLVFQLNAREFATMTIDSRDLPANVEYGRDYKLAVYVATSLEPDSNDPQVCRDVWEEFLDSQWKATPMTPGNSAEWREVHLDSNKCAWLRNPLAFEAFQAAFGSQCDSASAECFFYNVAGCAAGAARQSVHELYLHALVDVEFRIEIQILNGQFMPERFRFLQSVSVDVRAPARALLGSSNAFVIETNAVIAATVNYPYNNPLLQTVASAAPGNISGAVATSQFGIYNSAFLSWLPRNEAVALSNCMRHTDAWAEYLFNAGDYFPAAGRQRLYQTHLPYFSNCRGFGSAIPLWFVLENNPGCVNVPQNETVPVGVLSFRQAGVGDTCAAVAIECMVDEVPNDKQQVARWFESATGVELFRISRTHRSNEQFALLEGDVGLGDFVPVVVREGAKTDGTWMHSVELKLRYWQQTTAEKSITTADVYFGDFKQLTDAQSKGNAPWTYSLKISWSPMTHIEVFNAYSFPFSVYVLLAVIVGAISLVIVLGHWGFHWFLSPNRMFATSLIDRRYSQLILTALWKGVALAFVPAAIAFFLMILLFQGETSFFTLSLFTCDPASAYGCKVAFLDGLESSWSGESMSSPNSYATRRNGRAATVLLVLGSYLMLVTMQAFVPRLVSHYYDNEAEEETDDDQDRSWPPDQQIFAPLVHKRSTWFLLLASSCIVCTLVMEFSFSTAFTDLWWLYAVATVLVGKAVGWLTDWILREELLKIPIAALFETVLHVITLGSPDYYSFVITLFITQAVLIVDRTYIAPSERSIAATASQSYGRFRKWLATVFGGGKLAVAETVRAAEEPAPSQQEQNTGMMFFLSAFVSSLLAAILTPITLLVFAMLYAPAQTLNFYNVSESQAKFYWAFQFAMLLFRLLADIVSLNTAEAFHEWKILDYLEYCRYRFVSRPHRWKGVNEIADELISPELRSLDLLCFSSQFYFALFLVSIGAVFFVVGLQVTVNNAWNVFDDQATPFIVIGGILLLNLLKGTMVITADYLRLWVIARRGDGSVTDDGEIGELFEDQDKEAVVKAPASSALFSWQEPSAGDNVGWERYRLSYLRENRLWLQAHMDGLIDGPTTVEYRRLLMDSLAKVLKESNILTLSQKDGPGLQLGALPPHEDVARLIADDRDLISGTGIELAARTWLWRARFLRYLRETVSQMTLSQAVLKQYCEVCGVMADRAFLYIVPEYPVIFVAGQLRSQRNFIETWNLPLWQHFFSTFTPACTLCEGCASFYSARDVPVPVTESRLHVLRALPASCQQVLDESPFRLPTQPLPVDAAQTVGELFRWAEFCEAPDRSIDDLFAPVIPESAAEMVKEWLRIARIQR